MTQDHRQLVEATEEDLRRIRNGKACSLSGCREWKHARFAKKTTHRWQRRAGKLLVDVWMKIGGWHT